jgi:hypothetical protein
MRRALATLVAPLLAIGGFAAYLALTTGFGVFRRIPTEFLAIVAFGAGLGLWRAARRPTVGTVVAALLCLAIAGFGSWWLFDYSMYGAREERPAVGERFPDFTLPDSRGGTFDLASARGRPILLLFYRGDW